MTSSGRSVDQPVNDLLSKLLDDELDDCELKCLANLLRCDLHARQLYYDHIALHAILRWMDSGPQQAELAMSPLVQHLPFSDQPSPHSTPPLSLSFPPTTLHSPLDYLPESWLVAYLTALVICGIGILIGAFTYVSQPGEVARELSVIAKDNVVAEPQREFVGRITGMVDCKWAKSSDPLLSNDGVSLGHEFKIESGLVEIGYNTGAAVILQGPVTYVVESKNGGFMSVGKLTGKVTTKNAKGFSVRTPTATVTDLGTEFGVEVDDQKACHVETFVGLVVVSPATGGGSKDSRPLTLAAGEVLCIDAAGAMAKTSTKSTRFVRNIAQQIPDAYARVVLKDRPLVYWPLNESPTASWVTDRSGHGCNGHFVGNVRLMHGGPFAANRSRSAEFFGNGHIQTDPLPKSDPTKGFSVEAWARADGGNGQGMTRFLITFREDRDVPTRTGFALYAAMNDHWVFQTGIGTFWAEIGGPSVVPGQWVYVVGTFAPTDKDSDGVFMGIKKFYINGDPVATERQPWKPNDDMVPTRIGAGVIGSLPVCFFIGRIAQVAIYDRPLDENQIKAHWEAGKPSNIAVGPPGKTGAIKEKSKRGIESEVKYTNPFTTFLRRHHLRYEQVPMGMC